MSAIVLAGQGNAGLDQGGKVKDMLSLEQIEQQFPEALRPFKRAMLREYLQYKILEIIFASRYADKLSFIGGTALRIVLGNSRFSEDLDFDNFGLTAQDFDKLAAKVKKELEIFGLNVSVDTVVKGAFRCNVRLSGLLFDVGLSKQKEERILIQIDSESQGFEYKPQKTILNKFDVFSEVFVTPSDILLSQKIYASMNRKRAKGRDFFDIVFLFSLTRPNLDYLTVKLGVKDFGSLREKILSSIAAYDFKDLASDVRPFLFNSNDARKVELYREFISQALSI